MTIIQIYVMQTLPTLSLEYEYRGIHYRTRLCHETKKEHVLEKGVPTEKTLSRGH